MKHREISEQEAYEWLQKFYKERDNRLYHPETDDDSETDESYNPFAPDSDDCENPFESDPGECENPFSSDPPEVDDALFGYVSLMKYYKGEL